MILYNLILIASLPLSLPVFVLLMLSRPEYRTGLFERLGYLSGNWSKKTKHQTRLWIHAASVGEHQAVLPLIELWLRERPEWDLVLSVMTPTSRRLAEARFGKQLRIFFFPADLPGVAGRVIRHLAPDMILLVETELWPNFLRSASRCKIPVLLINGRISPRSYPRYRAVRGWVRETLYCIQVFCMQTSEDAQRIIQLGAPPERVRVLGNLKFDQTAAPLSEAERRDLLKSLGWGPADRIIVAGSTHEKEEEFLLNSYGRIKAETPDVRLILAPRHLNRVPGLVRLLEERGIIYRRYSELDSSRSDKAVDLFLVDTMGRLGPLYGLGTVVFVGGSLVPVGGHNLLEPALLGRPVLFGPFIQHVHEMAGLLSASGGGRRVRDPEDLTRQIRQLLVDAEQRQKMGRKALETVSRHQGASRKGFAIVDRELQKRSFDRIRRLDFRSAPERWFKDRLLASRGGILTSLAALFLRLVSFGYQGWQAIRAAAYSRGLIKSVRLDRPVISVGNLTLGGTGKTPTVMTICRLLIQSDHQPAVLSRGYGARSKEKIQVVSDPAGVHRTPDEAGDEPCLMADRLPGVPMLVAPDRAAAGRYAVRVFGPSVLVLDDGYQHLRLRRDLNLLVIDADQPFGNGFVFPRGTLREPIRQLRRADAILLTHVNDPAETEELQKFIRQHRPGVPIFTGRYQTVELIRLHTGQPLPFDKIRRNRVMAVAGIGQPDRFFRMLQETGAEIAVGCIYPDHYRYRIKDLEFLEQEAGRLEVLKIITTEKDAVRLKTLGKPLESWWSVRVELILDDPEKFETLLYEALQ